jgi:hypothetical protein
LARHAPQVRLESRHAGTSSHLRLDPSAPSAAEIVNTYSLRFKIEAGFKSFVQVLWGFGYRFWMKAMLSRKRTAKSQYLHRATDSYRQGIRRKVEAYDRFVNIAAMALGILQLVSLRYAQAIHARMPLWFRTVRSTTAPSENLVKAALQAEVPRIFAAKLFKAAGEVTRMEGALRVVRALEEPAELEGDSADMGLVGCAHSGRAPTTARGDALRISTMSIAVSPG